MERKSVVYEFGDVRVEPLSFRALKGGRPVPLEPKAFEALVYLVEHRGRVVEKAELLDAVWKETFVTPNAMTRVIAQLRKALGDDARESHLIETVPTRGYRFIADVRTAGESDPEAPTPPPAASPTGQALGWRLALAGAGVVILLAALLAWGYFRRPAPAEAVRVLKTTQLTTSVGLDLHPAFSPDGASLAYSAMRGGRFELCLKPLAPGGRELQLTSDGQDNFQPAWSPDGKLIVYHARGRGGLWVMSGLGGVARQLTEFGTRPAWSRDGQSILFQSGELADVGQAAFGAMPPSTLWVVPARGGAPRQITRPGEPAGGHGSPSWSPDGRRIIFVTNDLGNSEVWTVAPDGGGLTRLGGGEANYYDPVYAPDGRHVYLATASGNFRLWKVPVSPETGTSFGEPQEVANTGSFLPRHLTVSPDGKRVAYSALAMTNNLGSAPISPATHEPTGPPRLLTQDTNQRKIMHAFSPDGRLLAYNVWRLGAEGEVWMMEADGGNPRQLTAEPLRLLGWLPSGDEVLLAARGEGGPRVLAADWRTGLRRRLADLSGPLKMGRLSPDGRQFAYHVNDQGTINVATASLVGGPTKQLTFDREMMGFPCWSPDGRLLAFEVKRGEDTHVCVIPADGGTPEQLTDERGQSWPGGWSPDGDKIAYAGLRDGVWNIWWVSRRDRSRRRVTAYDRPNLYVRYPAWSPRGDQIVYEYAETTGNIWVIELK